MYHKIVCKTVSVLKVCKVVKSEKATKFEKSLPILFDIFVAFSDCLNFTVELPTLFLSKIQVLRTTYDMKRTKPELNNFHIDHNYLNVFFCFVYMTCHYFIIISVLS